MSEIKKYETEYKIQAVKLASSVGSKKAIDELGIPANTLYGWMRAAKNGRLDLGRGNQTPEDSLTIAAELQKLRAENKALLKENARIKEENEILAEATAFFAASRQKSAKKKE